jgi:hypothetical protein
LREAEEDPIDLFTRAIACRAKVHGIGRCEAPAEPEGLSINAARQSLALRIRSHAIALSDLRVESNSLGEGEVF